MVEIGNTFLIPTPPHYNKEHLYIVISIQNNNAFLVKVSPFNIHAEKACILKVGDHSFIKYPSAINYDRPIYTEIKNIEELVRAGEIRPHKSVSDSILEKIINGVEISVHLPEKYRSLFPSQSSPNKRG